MSRERRREIDRESRFLDVDIARAGASATTVWATSLRLVRVTFGVGKRPRFLTSGSRNLVRVLTKTVPILGSENGPESGTVFRPKFWGRKTVPILVSENGPEFGTVFRRHC